MFPYNRKKPMRVAFEAAMDLRYMQLQGSSILITGGRRVGGELALMLAGRGASVALTYHESRQRIEQLVAEIEKKGGRAVAIAADLRKPEEAERAVEQTVRSFDRIDALINMASIFERTPFGTLTAAQFDAMIAANLSAPAYVAIAAGQCMLEQKPSRERPHGKIINIGDWASDRPYHHYLPYLVGKGGLKTLTLALAKELAPRVAVNLIQPGMIDPPPEFPAETAARIISHTPLQYPGSPDDVNRLILYLLEGTDFATGGCFRIDGGSFLGQD